ncbi:MAG: hypothetical protein JRJ41_02180 [Deltaproteobacteria bacterium]|jgi:hypothetical protein|nr:hypothetical protein [Deltaproteobacteria bacterium]
MTEKTNNKQKNKKIVLALVWNLRFVTCPLVPCPSAIGFASGECRAGNGRRVYLKFGACDLLFI